MDRCQTELIASFVWSLLPHFIHVATPAVVAKPGDTLNSTRGFIPRRKLTKSTAMFSNTEMLVLSIAQEDVDNAHQRFMGLR
ncbi:hypothetical protein Y032_0303g1898 [Ancylostoma ceylanicum]|uniref:Uncharacterized protein n=1 Tax=Ancylostoma ceylanicum TaxID=53326 RepID=A0A016S3F7_9BILA|nr:hypothetical protein Y032_0303g1898 [Ancylostoma ceylanicum]